MKQIYALIILLLVCLISVFYYFHKPALHLQQTVFTNLPDWNKSQNLKALVAFKKSCKVFLKLAPTKEVGGKFIKMRAQDWYPSCLALAELRKETEDDARLFFEKWFTPVAFVESKPLEGLFTGYYMPILDGSLEKTIKYSVPLYKMPSDMLTIEGSLFDESLKNRKLIGRVKKNKVVPYYTRKEIDHGAIAQKADVIAWVASPVERMFLEIQGSGVIEIKDRKQKKYIGYAAENGAAYKAIASVLISEGVMTKDNASMQRIRKYLEENPKDMDRILHQNKSFVFFRETDVKAAIGSQGVALTPGRSLAVDLKWIPIGTPIWLTTTYPDATGNQELPLRRLMVAQDTGGAIRGPVRGDVFWGEGKDAADIAGRMKNPGFYWLLLPKHIARDM